jgi:hypothetical protein
VIAILAAIVFVVLQVHWGLLKPGDTSHTALSLTLPYLGILVCFLAWHWVRTQFLLDQDCQMEIFTLRSEKNNLLELKKKEDERRHWRLEQYIEYGKHLQEANYVPPSHFDDNLATCWMQRVDDWIEHANRQMKSDWPERNIDLHDTTGMSHAIEPGIHSKAAPKLNSMKFALRKLIDFRNALT